MVTTKSLVSRLLTRLNRDRSYDGRSRAPTNVAAVIGAASLFVAVAAADSRAQGERALTDADVPFVVVSEGVEVAPAPAVNLRRQERTAAAGASIPRGRKKRATHPAILKIVQEAGRSYAVDPELILAVMAQESNFNPTAVSYKKGRPCASGLMQLTAATAKRFGVTDPFDPEENIRGGVKYLRFLLDTFGDERLDLVLAGYNAGEGAVLRYNRSVPPYNETRNYVRSILAHYNSMRHLLTASAQ